MQTIEILDVTVRDGLQNEKKILPADVRSNLVKSIVEAGIKRVEAVSFVNPKKVPQMADAETVVQGLPQVDDVIYTALCLNLRGVQRAIDANQGVNHGIDEIGCVVVASDTFGVRNQGQSVEDGIANVAKSFELADKHNLRSQVTISAAFGCPFEGEIAEEKIINIATQLATLGPTEIALADTIGVATPSQVVSLFSKLRDIVPSGIPLRAHFHDTRGMGVVNVWSALSAGVSIFDASIGGTGGCPFAPKATGNVATEDIIYMLHDAKVKGDLDLDKLLTINAKLTELLEIELPSRVGHASGFMTPTCATLSA